MATVTGHESDAERCARQVREHAEKYARIARAVGVDVVKAAIPVPLARIREALAAGDVHLNTIPLPMWDRAAGVPAHPVPSGASFRDYADAVATLRELRRWPDSPDAQRRADAVLAREAERQLAARGGYIPPPGWRHVRETPRGYLSLAEVVCTLKHVARAWAEGSL